MGLHANFWLTVRLLLDFERLSMSDRAENEMVDSDQRAMSHIFIRRLTLLYGNFEEPFQEPAQEQNSED